MKSSRKTDVNGLRRRVIRLMLLVVISLMPFTTPGCILPKKHPEYKPPSKNAENHTKPKESTTGL